MIRWESFTDEEARKTWDQSLLTLPDYSPFQTFAWGEYRRALGWLPLRLAAFDKNDRIVAMMQVSLRRYPFEIGLLWSEGGPVGDLAACDETLTTALRTAAGLKRLYCRFKCDRERKVEDSLRLTAQRWAMPWSPLTSNYSMVLDLTGEEKALLGRCEQNWRRNLRRANEANLTVRQWLDPEVDEVLCVYTAMQNLKGLDEQHSREEIEQLLINLKQNIVLYRCDDQNGNILSLLGCLVTGEKACAVFWATNEQGRKLHSSYAIFWALVQHCRRIGLTSYDLAGIDPINNPGVYRFKRATGARAFEYLGEWDWASRPSLRWFGNWAIAKRSRIRQAESALGRTATKADKHATPVNSRTEIAGPSKVAA